MKKQTAAKAKKSPASKSVSASKKPPEKAGVKASTPAKKSGTAPVRESAVLVWDNDPGSGLKPSKRTVPQLEMGALSVQIGEGAPPPAGVHPFGTAAFRHWNCASAVQRAHELWSPHFPETMKWPGGPVLKIAIDESEDLNAYYDRQTISLRRATIRGEQVHTADSSDIIAHEYGHAVLDALRPDLWDAALDEVAAFHESFADLTALLAAMRSEPVASAVLKETGGYLFQNSCLSRFAAQYGRAVHAINENSAPSDCLRNAVNSFFYRDPIHLPPMAPHYELSSEPHSYSRLFTAGFFEGMAGMLKVTSASPRVEDVQQVAVDAAALLGKAVKTAALSAAFFSEMAAQVIWADTALFGGKYDDVLRSAFVRRGILSLEAARSLKAEATRSLPSTKQGHTADEAPRGRDIMMRASAFGMGEGALVLRTASFSRRGTIASAAVDSGSTPVPGVEQATQSFLETLFRRGRVDFTGCKPNLSSVPHTHIKRKTHYLLEQNGQYHLRRRCFDESCEDVF